MERRPANTATGRCYACRAVVLTSQLTQVHGLALGGGKHSYCPKCAAERKAGR